MNIYLVDGYVRDQLLEVKSKDKDYAVEAGSFQESAELIPTDLQIAITKWFWLC